MTIPWWKIIVPETRTKLQWRNNLQYYSIYSLSSLTFSFIGFLIFFYNKSNLFISSILIIQGITSFQSDVTYLGINTHWRTFDTLFATLFILYSLYTFKHSSFLHTFIAFSSFFFALFCFHKSQTSLFFIDREFWHTLWHFFLQYSSLFLFY